MSATPEQRRDAWLALVQVMERATAATLENARAGVSLHSSPDGDAAMVDEYDATAWAADRLLKALVKMPAPEIPEDPPKDQGDILTALQDARPVEDVPFPRKKGHW